MTPRLLSSGSNAYGQLGNGSVDDAHGFLTCTFLGDEGYLPAGATVLNVATGANHTLILLEITRIEGHRAKELWGCGDGRAGQLGYQYQQEMATGASSSVFRRLRLPLLQQGLQVFTIQQIYAGWETSYLVLSRPDNGDVLLSFGGDEYGDLGIGGKSKGNDNQPAKELNWVTFDHINVDGTPIIADDLRIKSISTSQHHVIAHLQSKSRHIVVGWGASRHGQIGNVLTPGQKPISIVDRPRIVFIEDFHDPLLYSAVGCQHTTFLFSSGRIHGIGSNRKGQLQGIETLPRCTALGCTWNGTFSLADHGIYAFGSNTHGQLGRKNPPNYAGKSFPGLEMVNFTDSLRNYVPCKLACGTEHVLTIWENRIDNGGTIFAEVWGWGWNEHGNLGIETTEDAHEPVKIWPRSSEDGLVVDIWAGAGTSWIFCTR